MNQSNVKLVSLQPEDREQFILDNQEAFRYGAVEEFGTRDEHYEEPGEIISRATIEASIDAADAETYRIVCEGEAVGGMILRINPETRHNHLEILFTKPGIHSKGVGYAAWQAAEQLHPETLVWETITPHFETRNIHFYINKCGFHAVEFFCPFHGGCPIPEGEEPGEDDDNMMMLRFEKVMK